MAWKKIGSWLVLSISAAVLGAACAATPEDPAPADVAEAPAEEEAALPVSPAPLDRDDHFDRERRERERCERHCDDGFRGCMSGFDRDRHGRRERCERRRFQCRRECERRHR